MKKITEKTILSDRRKRKAVSKKHHIPLDEVYYINELVEEYQNYIIELLKEKEK